MGELYLGKIYKRIFASLIDYLLVLGLAISFFMLLSNGIIDIGFHNYDLKQEQIALQDESHLFEVAYNEDGSYLGVNYLTYDLDDTESYIDFLEAITNFYYDFYDQEEKSNADLNINFFGFNEETLQNSIFSIENLDAGYQDFVLKTEVVDISTSTLVSVDDTDAYFEAIAQFFVNEDTGIYNYALTQFTLDSRFLEIEAEIVYVERLEVLISTILCSTLIFSIPIAINKHGQSLGMFFFKLGYTTRDGYKVKWYNKLIRILALIILSGISVYLYMIPMVINIIVLFVNKEKRSVIDLCANEVCVDLKTSVIYKDYQEMTDDEKKEEKHEKGTAR